MSSTWCIIGSGNYAGLLAQRLLEEGHSIIRISAYAEGQPIQHDQCLEWFPNVKRLACQGTIGNFSLRLATPETTVLKKANGILIADAYDLRSNLPALGLRPAESIMDISTFSNMIQDDRSSGAVLAQNLRIAYLNGMIAESYPFVLKEMLNHCLKLQNDYHCQTYLLTRNLKTAATGLEELYHQAKLAGTVFIKLTQTSPLMRQNDENKLEINYTDEIVRKKFRLEPDITIVDQSYFPSPDLAPLAQQLGLEQDANGFVQSDNVHRNGILTNRKGILAVGPARGILSPAELANDLALAVSAVRRLEQQLSLTVDAPVEINASKCIHCLTCYRICPYRAIELDPAPVINPTACEGCAICNAACPIGAINVDASASVNLSGINTEGKKTAGGAFNPRMVVFCCSRSAAEAYRQAADKEHAMPENLSIIELPCAGALSTEHIFRSFNRDIDALAIFTCHPDNCHGHYGNRLARRKAELVAQTFAEIGFEPERILVESFAANMGKCFAQKINGFAEKIKTLGPSRIRKSGTESS